MNKKSLKTRKW